MRVEFDKKEVYLGRRRRDTSSSRYRKNFVNEVRSDEVKEPAITRARVRDMGSCSYPFRARRFVT